MFVPGQYFVAPWLITEDAVSLPSGSAEPVAEVHQHTVVDLMMGSGPVVRLVLIILLIMSVITWGIVITKWLQMRQAKRQSNKFSDVFWSSRNLAQITEAGQKLTSSPVAKVYGAGHRELTHVVKAHEGGGEGSDFADLDNIDRALKRAKAEEITKLEQGTMFLATTASAAPFIGLFGTVWGIMNAFMGLSSVKSSSIQAVAPGISEALIATAIGLAAAIPAAIFYNYFMQQVRLLSRNMDIFSAEFLNIARRHFLK
ncbi:MAG: protein TolQ [Bdellovibrionota bacterium]